MKIWVYFIGKARDEAANAIAAEFVKRTTRYASCEMREIHPDRFDPWTKHPSAVKALLDPAGKQWTSEQFIQWISKTETEGRDVVFVLDKSGSMADVEPMFLAAQTVRITPRPMETP